MNIQIVVAVIAIAASVFLGAVSNWIYDLLKNRGLFPDKFTVKAAVTITLASSPLILLVAFSEVSDQERGSFFDFLQAPIPIWQVISIALFVFGGTWLLRERQIIRLASNLKDIRRDLSDTEQRLKASEARLDLYLKSNKYSQEESIINPR
jgi:Ni/Fe-hydrogenase subunit HybB-like protein